MASGLLRVLLLLCAVAAGARAQQWQDHGNPYPTRERKPIRTGMVPWPNTAGTRWYGLTGDYELWERRSVEYCRYHYRWRYHRNSWWFGGRWRRYRERSCTMVWSWSLKGKHDDIPQGYGADFEPCMLEGIEEIHQTTNAYLSGYSTRLNEWTYHGRPPSDDPVSSCSSVAKEGLKPRTFVHGRGSLWERYRETPSSGWTWRNHGKPFGHSVRDGKTSSYVADQSAGISHVYAVSRDGSQVFRRTTNEDHQNEEWSFYGEPTTKVQHVHATLAGGVWAIGYGQVCMRRGSNLFPCYAMPDSAWSVIDCSDPFRVSGGKAVFCTARNTDRDSSNRLYQVKLQDSPSDSEPTWTDHGAPSPRFAGMHHVFYGRPNVAFSGNSVRSVFVSSNMGVYELRF
ncbi:Hypp7541 [Branchiostoma lanceolatum]|uniref:Hypp7541 protein n=1 Tax=Branchiostoma lanceolatum TaxID=7740 RepID=A0A8K0EEA8_BRALA|nr:Hypp7541 [Branchiostoma lanceolatum]